MMMAKNHQDIAAADIEWREGTEDGVRYARFRMDDTNLSSPSIVLSKFLPGAAVPPHTHGTNYFEYIIKGEQMVGKTRFGPGDIRLVKAGTGYGPIKVGPNGCTVLIVFEDGARSMMDMLPGKIA